VDAKIENNVFINDRGFLEISMSAEQSEESVNETVDKAESLISKLISEGKKVKILVDITPMNKILSTQIRKVGFDRMRQLRFEKCAIITPNRLIRFLIDTFNRTLLRHSGVKVFSERPHAEAWLFET
jgi:hypothetical protein